MDVFLRNINILDSELVTVTGTPAFLFGGASPLLQNLKQGEGRDFWSVTLTNCGGATIYVNFTASSQCSSQGATTNVSTTQYSRSLAAGGDFQVWGVGSAALACMNVVTAGGSVGLNVAVGA